MRLSLLILLTAKLAVSHRKCCDRDSYLKKSNSTYGCDKDEDKRLQIFTQNANYLKHVNASEGSCLDVNQNITEFKIRNWTVVEETPVDVNFYPKCCPLDYFYDSSTHSCVWKDNIDHNFIKQKFIKVGLPQCRVIVDYELNSGMHHYHRMELDTLYIGNSTAFPEGKYCIDRDENDSLIARGCYEDLSVCTTIKCIHKCCPDGQSFVNGKKCENTYIHGLNLSFTDRINNSKDPFAIIHRYNCKMYVLKEKIQFYLDDKGVFWAFYNKTNTFEKFDVEQKSYCIEHAYKQGYAKNFNNFEFFMCFVEEPIKTKFLTSRWAKILSCISIVATIVIYLLLPEMLNLFGKILLSYCTSVLAVFIFLIYTQFETNVSDKTCITISFLSLYTSLCSFSWLNLMCFDIWWTFGSPKSLLTAKQKKSETRRFLFYGLYGWGVPACLTLITYLAYTVTTVPHAIRPYLGTYKCFWEKRRGNYAMFLYYVTPLIVMEVANLIFFVKTIAYCLKVKGEINRLNDNRIAVKERKKSFNSDKEQLFLILKLSVIMGISFVFEVVSSLYTFSLNSVTKYIEIVWDTFNCLQGVFIFLIFVCKVKVIRLCRTKIRGVKARKISLSSLPTGNTQVLTPLTSTSASSKIRNV